MVAYGPWTQDPDYEVVRASSPSWSDAAADRAPRPGGHGEVVTLADRYNLVADGQAAEAHITALGNTSGLPPANTAVEARKQWSDPVIGTSTWKSGAYVDTNFQPWPLDPRDYYSAPRPWPEGAVGVEYDTEDGLSVPLDAWLAASTEMVSVDTDETTDLKLSVPDYQTTVRVSPGVEGDQWNHDAGLSSQVGLIPGPRGLANGSPTVWTLDADIHLWPRIGSAGGWGWVWTSQDQFVGSRGSGEVRVQNITHWRWGAIINRHHVRWTFRPPRYRFIFDELDEPPPTYRRVFPRDDSLAGGAGRNFPRPRSVQSSNRLGGGYL